VKFALLQKGGFMKSLSTKEIITLGFLLFVAVNFSACNQSIVTPSGIENSASEQSETIIGGSVVSTTDSISQSTIILLDTEKGGLCTGNIIARNLILTAAHCTQKNPQKIIAVFSAKMPQSAEELRKMNWRRILGGKTSPAWPLLTENKEKDWGDIAILKFEGEIPAGFKAIKLLSRKESIRTGMNITLAGFGITDGIQHTETEALRKVSVKVANANYSATEILIDQRSGRGACHGDSGGPAVIKVGKFDVLVGITSRGSKDPKDTCLQYSVYTSIAGNLQWIQKAAQEISAAEFTGGTISQPAVLE